MSHSLRNRTQQKASISISFPYLFLHDAEQRTVGDEAGSDGVGLDGSEGGTSEHHWG